MLIACLSGRMLNYSAKKINLSGDASTHRILNSSASCVKENTGIKKSAA
jgi:hypothetical protein